MSNKVKNEMAEINQAQSNKARRNLLLGGAAGVALGAWHTPIVKSVITPAHAQTTTDDSGLPLLGPGPFFSAPTITNNQASPNSILDVIIPKAYAGRRPLSSVYSQVTPVGANQYRVEIRNGKNTLARIGTLTVGVAGVLVPEGRTCRFDLPHSENGSGNWQTGNSQVNLNFDSSEANGKKGILDYLIPEAKAGMNVIANPNGQALVEREADPWVCTIVSVNETEVTVDIPDLSPSVDTIPAGDGVLPPLITTCEIREGDMSER
jgi:hypothetical protein